MQFSRFALSYREAFHSLSFVFLIPMKSPFHSSSFLFFAVCVCVSSDHTKTNILPILSLNFLFFFFFLTFSRLVEENTETSLPSRVSILLTSLAFHARLVIRRRRRSSSERQEEREDRHTNIRSIARKSKDRKKKVQQTPTDKLRRKTTKD